MHRTVVRIFVAGCATLLIADLPLRGQDVVTTGPRPEIRALLDAFSKALNGTPEAWEAMANERFSPTLLKQRPAADRKQLFEKLRAQFGTATFERVMREGPDAPLEIHVKGSNGSTGTITLDIAETTPPKISGIRLNNDTGAKDSPRPDVNLPIHGRMAPDELSSALDAYLSRLTSGDEFSGVVLVAKKNALVLHKAYGFADRANKIPNTVQTRFNIGSINKSFTRLAIDQLVAQGNVRYSDTLEHFFSDYPQPLSRTATVQQLLAHTAGISDFFGPDFRNTPKDRFRSNADYFRFVSTLQPTFAPGARNQYCNGCYIALGAIVEKVAAVPYEEYVTRNIFKPAGMDSTGYPQGDAIEPAVAIGYTRRQADGALRSNVYLHGAAGSAAGGGYSTALDLLNYVKARREGRLPRLADGQFGIAGGSAGTNAVLEANKTWTVVVLTNLDPPAGERLGVAIGRALGE